MLGPEAARAHARRLGNGFYDRYLSGSNVLDIGYRGTEADAEPITKCAIGVELDYPGYDGRRLPFPDCSQDTVFASHVLEHLTDSAGGLVDWFRTLKTGGFLIICVPHHLIYERRPSLPSMWNPDHRRTFTATSLLSDVAESLPVNGYRIRHLEEHDEDFDYARPPDQPPVGSYEIELVLEKIKIPYYSDLLWRAIRIERHVASVHSELLDALKAHLSGRLQFEVLGGLVRRFHTFPSWTKVQAFINPGRDDLESIAAVVRPLLEHLDVDEPWYLNVNPDLAQAAAQGALVSPAQHWRERGYFEDRAPCW